MVSPTVSVPSNPLPQVERDFLSIQDAYRKYSRYLVRDIRETDIIGQGSFGTVYQGELTDSKEKVVVKVLRCAGDDNTSPEKKIRRLLREVEVWETLDHRNVAAFCGLDFSNSNVQQLSGIEVSEEYSGKVLFVPGLISPYLEFDILNYVLKHPGRREACVIDLARGLTYLHHRSAIHGDLRPENMRVTDHGLVKIIDFGFSKLKNCCGFTTRAYTNLSSRYAAPEILDPEDSNAPVKPTSESDVYSFSMCMLQLLAHPDNPGSSIPLNHVPRDPDWLCLKAVCMEKQQPLRDYYTRAITDLQWEVMARCWNHQKNKRPDIHDVFEDLNGIKCSSSRGDCWV